LQKGFSLAGALLALGALALRSIADETRPGAG